MYVRLDICDWADNWYQVSLKYVGEFSFFVVVFCYDEVVSLLRSIDIIWHTVIHKYILDIQIRIGFMMNESN